MSMAAAAVEVGNGYPKDDKVQLLETFKPPVYFPPYPVKINPHFVRMKGAFREKATQWTLHHKVDTILRPKVYKMLLDMDVCGLAARIYSDAGEWELEWACKFLIMLWVWDDSLDDSDMGKSPEAAISNLLDAQLVMMWSFPDDPVLNTQLEYVLSHLEGQQLEEKTRYIESVLSEARTKPDTVYSNDSKSILCSVYLDFWTGAVKGASPEFCLRLAHGMQEWLSACLQEAYVRKTETNPESIDIDDYVQNRRGTSAILATLVIIDKVYNLSMPDSWFYSTEMKRVFDAVLDIVSWHNDIWSFKREVLVRNHTQNIVLLISLKRKISYTEAAELTTRMVYNKIANLDQGTLDLESVTLPEHRRAFDLYILTFRNWVSGCHDWHINSARYQ